MTAPRTLLLLRHATAEPARPGERDADRRLSPRGGTEADGVGDFLRAEGLRVDRVLCSPAVRTRQTLDRLRLDAPTEVVPLLYQAGAEQILELVAAADAATVLVVGHAPGVPGVLDELAEPRATRLRQAQARGFPPATLARLEVADSWYDPSSARLIGLRIPDGRDGRYLC